MDAYGYVETLGLVTAIEAADAALKAADVTLTNCYFVKGGIVTIEVTGDVAAVNAAVDAGTESAKRLGNFLCNNGIARVDSETKKILVSDLDKGEKEDEKTEAVKEITVEETVVETPEEETVEVKKEEITEKTEIKEEVKVIAKKIEDDNVKVQKVQEKKVKEEVSKEETPKKEDGEVKKLKKQYQDMKVVDLKMKVNSLKLGYTWNQIKTMPKKKLIEILIKNNQEE